MSTLTLTDFSATRSTSNFAAALTFAQALLGANLKRPKAFLISTFTPLFILVLFWVLSINEEGGKPDEIDITRFMFPSVIGMAVMFAGQAVATRVTTWRQQQIFQRLAVTPAPLGALVAGMALAEMIGATLQGLLVLLFGVIVLQLPVNWLGALLVIGVMLLGSWTFAALGGVIASLVRNPQTASSVFIFLLMPLFFLGGGFPPEILPPTLRLISPYLPTQMFTNLLRSLLETGVLPQDTLGSLGGLVLYGAIFTGMTVAWFRSE